MVLETMKDGNVPNSSRQVGNVVLLRHGPGYILCECTVHYID